MSLLRQSRVFEISKLYLSRRALKLREEALDLRNRATHTQVPGSQLVTMTLHDLTTDLEMSKLQAKRVLLKLETRTEGEAGGGGK